jgi:predicted nuclease with TOPRIM domain
VSTTQENIKKVLGNIHELEKVKRHFSKLEKERSETENAISAAEKKLDENYKDIENLENFSIKGIFYKVLGSKEKQIEKERQEYLHTALKSKELKKKLELINYEIDLMSAKTGDLPGLRNELENLKIKRQDEMIWSGTAEGKRLTQILEQQDGLLITLKEIKEARLEGEACTKDLNAIIAHLNKAKDWGNWDMMGKGRMADYYRRDAMDRVRDISIHAQRSLNRFDRELQDIGKDHLNLEIKIESVSGFLDFFMDNLISDWIVQQKINNSLGNAKSVIEQVNQICLSLDDHVADIDIQIADLDKEKDKLILH